MYLLCSLVFKNFFWIWKHKLWVKIIDDEDASFVSMSSLILQHDDACKDYVTSLCTQNLMQCALGMAGALSSLTSKERPLLYVTRQLTELVIMSGFKRVKDAQILVLNWKLFYIILFLPDNFWLTNFSKLFMENY